MNNVSFSGIYLHSYPNSKAMFRALNKFETGKERIVKALGPDFCKTEALCLGGLIRPNALPPEDARRSILVCTGKDAAGLGKQLDRTEVVYVDARDYVDSLIAKAKQLIHN